MMSVTVFRCPICRTRRKDQSLLLQHLEQSGHGKDQLCRCSAYKYPHRTGSACEPVQQSRGGGSVAKQDGDTYTQELPLEAVTLPRGVTVTAVHLNGKAVEFTVTEKRGRGRPRLDNPKSQAERAAAYRERKREAKAYAARLKANGCTGMYRGPNGETWTGRGLMPKWLSVLVREGIDKQSFFVTL